MGFADFLYTNPWIKKNPAYGRHQLSQPMRIVGPIKFLRGCVIRSTPEHIPDFRALLGTTDPHRKTDLVHAKMRTRSTLWWGLGPRENADSVHSGTHPLL